MSSIECLWNITVFPVYFRMSLYCVFIGVSTFAGESNEVLRPMQGTLLQIVFNTGKVSFGMRLCKLVDKRSIFS